MALAGIQVSSSGVRGVWSRHGLLGKHDRLMRLEKASADRIVQLNEEQVVALERFTLSSANATSMPTTAAIWLPVRARQLSADYFLSTAELPHGSASSHPPVIPHP
jgi:hypothetical protein